MLFVVYCLILRLRFDICGLVVAGLFWLVFFVGFGVIFVWVLDVCLLGWVCLIAPQFVICCDCEFVDFCFPMLVSG